MENHWILIAAVTLLMLSTTVLGRMLHYAPASLGRSPNPPSHEVVSIAVLPFANLSLEKDTEYFGDGLAEELINALTKLESTRVVAQTSTFQFRGKTGDIRKIGRELNAGTVLEGSVRRAGNRLRISVRLSDVASGYELWSNMYDCAVKDGFDVQEQISLAVVKALRINQARRQ